MRHLFRSPLSSTILLGIIACFFIFLPSPSADGIYGHEPTQYQVILLSENSLHEAGDNLTIEILFFDEDTPVDASEFNISIGRWGDRYVEEEPTRITTGHYSLTFQIQEEDFGDWYAFRVVIICTADGARSEADSAAGEIAIYREGDDFHAALTVDKPTFGPGDNVTFQLTTTSEGTPVEADWIDILLYLNGEELWVYLGDGPIHGMNRVDTGVYQYWYHAPDDDVSKEIAMVVEDVTYRDEVIFDLEVTAVQKFFDIWLLTEDQSETHLDGKIGVSDLSGDPVQCDVTVEYSYLNTTYYDISKSFTGSTNSDGLMDLHLEYEDILLSSAWGVDLIINATEKGTRDGGPLSQVVSFEVKYLIVREPPIIWSVNPQFDFNDLLPVDSPVRLEFLVTTNETPLPNIDVISYIQSADFQAGLPGGAWDGVMGEFFGARRHTTDSEGRFFLEFTTPDHAVDMVTWFKGIDSSSGSDVWEEFERYLLVSDFYARDSDLQIEVENFGSGQEATVTLTVPGIEGGFGDAFILSIDPSQTPNIEDIPFTALFPERFGMNRAPVYQLNEPYRDNFTGDTLETKITVPTFAPTGNHFIIAGFIEPTGSPPTGEIFYPTIIWNYIIIDIDGNPVTGMRSFVTSSSFPHQILSGESYEWTITVTEGYEIGGDPLEGALVNLEVVGPAEVNVPSGLTNADGEFTFTITAQKVTENTTFIFYVNSSKDGYRGNSVGNDMVIKVDDGSNGGGNGGNNGDDDEGSGALWIVLLFVVIAIAILGYPYQQGALPIGDREKDGSDQGKDSTRNEQDSTGKGPEPKSPSPDGKDIDSTGSDEEKIISS